MAWLVGGLVVFFGTHLVRIVAADLRQAAITRMGEGPWKGLYTLVSLVGFGLIIWGWSQYRPVAAEVYVPPGWGRHAAMLLVLAAFVLMAAAYVPTGYMKAWLKHPFIVGVGLWAFAHLLANGDLASLLLFGAFLAYSAVYRIAVLSRGDPVSTKPAPMGDVLAVLVGATAFVVFAFWLHGFLFGVAPVQI